MRLQDDVHTNVTDCIFDHIVITKQYDVYRSVRYPQSLPSCLNRPTQPPDAPSSTPNPDVGGKQSRDARLCQGSWYLGVSRNGSIRVVKSTRRLPPSKSFFYQSWVHKQTPRGSSQLPPSHPPINLLVNGPFARPKYDTTTAKTESRDRPLSRNKVKSGSRPAFPLLSGVGRRRGDKLTSATGGLEPLGAGCGANLLSSCRRNRPTTTTNKKRRSARLRRRRTVT
jgi:hypothetical protein